MRPDHYCLRFLLLAAIMGCTSALGPEPTSADESPSGVILYERSQRREAIGEIPPDRNPLMELRAEDVVQASVEGISIFLGEARYDPTYNPTPERISYSATWYLRDGATAKLLAALKGFHMLSLHIKISSEMYGGFVSGYKDEATVTVSDLDSLDQAIGVAKILTKKVTLDFLNPPATPAGPPMPTKHRNFR